MPIDAQTLFEETKCYACYGVSAPDLLKLGLLNRIAGGSSSGGGSSGALLIVNNLTDVANAATSFGNIKQAATTVATGVAELATNAECITGTDTTRIVTPAGLAAANTSRGWDAVIVKQADQTVTNSTVLVNDNELVFPVAASSFYQVMLILNYNGTATNNYVGEFLFPDVTGGVAVPGIGYQGYYNAGLAQSFQNIASNLTTIPAGGTIYGTTGGGAGFTLPLFMFFILNTGPLSGNLQWKFAQGTAGVGTTAVTLAKSTLFVKKLV